MHALVQAIFRAPITLMVAKVYVPVLFPLTFLISLIALKLDGLLGFPLLFETPTNWFVAGTSFIVGFALWIWTYEQLTRLGEGSPSPTAGRTMKLVKSGIYAHSRNPSIFGKLLGVLSVGFALNSISFVCVLVPLLLTGSLIEKVWRQEPQLVEIFGEEYEKYRKEVPLFFPWKLLLPSRNHSTP
ncbi:MAG: methyltransferase family protein [Myxococcota bacterium]